MVYAHRDQGATPVLGQFQVNGQQVHVLQVVCIPGASRFASWPVLPCCVRLIKRAPPLVLKQPMAGRKSACLAALTAVTSGLDLKLRGPGLTEISAG